MKTPASPVSSFLDHVLVDSTDSCSMSMTDDTVTIKHTDGPCQTATTTVEGENVVRLRGLPFSATPEDVRVFFGSCELQEVYFVRRDGKWIPSQEERETLGGRGCQVRERTTKLSPYAKFKLLSYLHK